MIYVPQGLVLPLKSAVDLGELQMVFHFDENVHYLRFLLFIAGVARCFVDSVVLLLERALEFSCDFELAQPRRRIATVDLVNDSVQYSLHNIISMMLQKVIS